MTIEIKLINSTDNKSLDQLAEGDIIKVLLIKCNGKHIQTEENEGAKYLLCIGKKERGMHFVYRNFGFGIRDLFLPIESFSIKSSVKDKGNTIFSARYYPNNIINCMFPDKNYIEKTLMLAQAGL